MVAEATMFHVEHTPQGQAAGAAGRAQAGRAVAADAGREAGGCPLPEVAARPRASGAACRGAATRFPARGCCHLGLMTTAVGINRRGQQNQRGGLPPRTPALPRAPCCPCRLRYHIK